MDAQDQADFLIPVAFEKVNVDQQIVYGWASVTKNGGIEVVDLQGDSMDIEDLRKAVYDFMSTDRVSGIMHVQKADGTVVRTGQVVDSLVVTSDLAKTLGMDQGREGWLIGVKVEDTEIWKACRSGALRGFSIGGKGQRVPV